MAGRRACATAAMTEIYWDGQKVAWKVLMLDDESADEMAAFEVVEMET